LWTDLLRNNVRFFAWIANTKQDHTQPHSSLLDDIRTSTRKVKYEETVITTNNWPVSVANVYALARNNRHNCALAHHTCYFDEENCFLTNFVTRVYYGQVNSLDFTYRPWTPFSSHPMSILLCGAPGEHTMYRWLRPISAAMMSPSVLQLGKNDSIGSTFTWITTWSTVAEEASGDCRCTTGPGAQNGTAAASPRLVRSYQTYHETPI